MTKNIFILLFFFSFQIIIPSICSHASIARYTLYMDPLVPDTAGENLG